MYIAAVPNRNSPPAILLREGYREGGKVKTRTLANLSKLPKDALEALRLALKGKRLAPVEDIFRITDSRHHGHARAVTQAMKRLGMESLLGSKRCRERQIVLAMIGARILDPQSKLATATCLGNTTLPDLVGVGAVTEDEMYDAMDWLFARQKRIEDKLAKRHLRDGGLALYDLTSSYFEGSTCPLAKLGYSRDGKKGTLQVNYGLLTDERGRPVSVSVFEGNVGDTKTLMPQVQACRERFGLQRFAIVGDRGMITQKQIDELPNKGVDWISALRPDAIRKLVGDGSIQMGLFDERNIAEIAHEAFPGERLIVCRNPELARRRAAKREDLLAATEKKLDVVMRMAGDGKGRRIKGKDKIGVRAGRVVNAYKVAKHFVLDVGENSFAYRRDERSIATEAALDGIYVVRTSLPDQDIDRDEVVRSYKRLAQVERAFRSTKTMDLLVRPIHHRTENRVRAHIFLCMLAYYVRLHMLEAWRPLLFCDQDLDAKKTRDPVAPARRSAAADNKAASKTTAEGHRVHSFQTLLRDLSTIVRNTCLQPHAPDGAGTIELDTLPNEHQRRALELIETIAM